MTKNYGHVSARRNLETRANILKGVGRWKPETYVAIFAAAICTCVLVVDWLDILTFNTSPSAATGFYIRDASNPTYVSFCLSQKQAEQFPAIACTTADDRKPRILKEIGHVANGAYWVISSHPDAIDSDTIGYVRESQLKAKWRLLWEFER